MASHLLAFVALIVLALTSGFAEAQSPADPATFFGGRDNDAYVEWLQDASYDRFEFLPSPQGNETGAAIHWTLKDDQIFLAMAAKATGWISFGIAESGGMFGADVVTYMADTDSLIDGYIEDERFVLRDDCQSWTLLNAVSSGGFLVFEAVRAIDTGDTQDRPIMADGRPGDVPSRVIVAWSDSPSLDNHGPNNRASTALRFHGTQEGNDFDLIMANEAEGFIELKVEDYNIKNIDTEYAYFCFSYADLVAQGMPENVELHAIGFEPIIDPRSTKYVHHFVLQASNDGDVIPADGNCSAIDFIDIAYLWAPGEGPLSLPSYLGGPLGENGFKSFQLETHYNNPWLDEGVLDSSGVRIYYTSQKREHDIGILSMGDPFISLRDEAVGNSALASHQFDCPASCSSAVVDEKVTVVREYLHMHKAGAAMANYHMRDGEVIRVGKVDFFDFSQQGGYGVQQPPFEILPGDSFRTVCQYDTSNNGTIFGLSSQEEMCIAFLMYYPRTVRPTMFGFDLPYVCGYDIPVPDCSSDWQREDLESTSELGRTFGQSLEICPDTTTASGSTSGAIMFTSSVVSAVFALMAILLNA